jgi:7-cyano-7-deazaguanine synthase in queuosine biosynthesis
MNRLAACLSGGVNSFVAAAMVKELKNSVRVGVFVDYGQNEHIVHMANAQAVFLGIPFITVHTDSMCIEARNAHRNIVIASLAANFGCDFDINGIVLGCREMSYDFQRTLAHLLSVNAQTMWTVHIPLIRHSQDDVIRYANEHDMRIDTLVWDEQAEG